MSSFTINSNHTLARRSNSRTDDKTKSNSNNDEVVTTTTTMTATAATTTTTSGATPQKIEKSLVSSMSVAASTIPSIKSKTSSSPSLVSSSSSIKGIPTPPESFSLNNDSNAPVSWSFRNFVQKWKHRIPFLKTASDLMLRIPPRVRMWFVVFWFCWKIVVGIAVVVVILSQPDDATNNNSLSSSGNKNNFTTNQPTKILYIITTLAEFNNGLRATTKGQDRLGEVLVPILVDSVQSMIAPPFDYQVDVFLILGYPLRPEREQYIRNSLPEGIGLEIWDDATPLGYDKKHDENKIVLNTRTLARQHRYVIKDKFFDYDLFLAFEDDMRITGHHVRHFLDMSYELDSLRKFAPNSLDDVPEQMEDPKTMKFFGPMTERQMQRLIPGFIRVEVLLNETENGAQTKLDPIQLDNQFEDRNGNLQEYHINPSICCHVHMYPNTGTPTTPKASDLVIWETNVKAFSLRHLSGSSYLDWLVLMLGPGKRLSKHEMVGGFWSGRDGAFGDENRPSGGAPDLLAQQGGWMATRDQIARLNSGLCMGSFLPPFDQPDYNADGQESMNVEFWSGSYQFFTGVRSGCNMQRVISMHPDHFSNHLLYHVANNKQRQLSRERMLRADHLFAQLNTVKKMAAKTKAAMES